jgi:hypothetical protein
MANKNLHDFTTLHSDLGEYRTINEVRLNFLKTREPKTNPRRQRWSAHFRIDGGAIVPLTDAGALAVHRLDINPQTRVEMRATRAQHPFDPRR